MFFATFFAFFGDIILTIVTLGGWLIFTPDKKMLMGRVSKWYIRKCLNEDAETDPVLKENLIKMGWYEKY